MRPQAVQRWHHPTGVLCARVVVCLYNSCRCCHMLAALPAAQGALCQLREVVLAKHQTHCVVCQQLLFGSIESLL